MEQGELDQSQEENAEFNQSSASGLLDPSLEPSYQDISRLPEQYFRNRPSVSSGPLEGISSTQHLSRRPTMHSVFTHFLTADEPF